MKRFRFMPKLAAAIVSAAMIFSGAVPAFAEASNGNTAISGNTVTFKTILVLDLDTLGGQKRIPAKTFHYEITPGADQAATGSNLPIYAGKLSNTKTLTTEANIAAKDVNTDTSSETVNTTIDFTGVDWGAPGIYRYNVKNTDTASNAYDGTGFGKTMTLDVAVVNNTDGTGYHIDHAALVDTTTKDGKTTTSKVDNFAFKYHSKYLKFTKIVAGSQGNQNKYFKFTLSMTGLTGLDKLYVTTTSTSTNTDAQKDGIISVKNGSTGDIVFYLKHNENVIINNLPVGYNFTLSEDNAAITADGYKASIDSASNLQMTNGSTTNNTVKNSLSFNVTNTKEGIVPTGVIFAVAPFAIGAVAIAAFVILKVRKAAKQ